MPEPYTANDLLNAIAVASKTLSERKDEITRLPLFFIFLHFPILLFLY